MPQQFSLQDVAEILDHIRPVDSGRRSLYILNDTLHVTRLGELPNDAQLVGTLSQTDINDGLSPKMWAKIDDRLRRYAETGTIEWEPRERSTTPTSTPSSTPSPPQQNGATRTCGP